MPARVETHHLAFASPAAEAALLASRPEEFHSVTLPDPWSSPNPRVVWTKLLISNRNLTAMTTMALKMCDSTGVSFGDIDILDVVTYANFKAAGDQSLVVERQQRADVLELNRTTMQNAAQTSITAMQAAGILSSDAGMLRQQLAGLYRELVQANEAEAPNP